MLQKLNTLQKSLKNIFLCKLLRIRSKLKYPFQILPCSKFKTSIDCDSLINNQDIYILRRSNLSVDETFKPMLGQNVLNDDAIDDIRIANLSVNLLGGHFKKEHNKFVALKAGVDKWIGEKVYLSNYIKDYSIEEDKGLIFINTKVLHNIEVPYNLPSDPNLHKEATKFQKIIGNNRVLINTPKETIRVIGKSFFVHSPVNLNYWHFELKVENFSEEIIDNPKKKSDKRFLEQLFTNIIKLNALAEIDIVEKIDKSYYSA